ncbi:hypothetical protein ABPG77_000266 [Micractinium sp. CCAP 211/92]
MPASILELIAERLSLTQKLAMCGVNRHWRQALVGSRLLWNCTELDLTDAGEKRMAQILDFVAARAEGIRELELTLGCGKQWPEATFLLGMLHPTLRRLLVAAPDLAAELPAGGAAYLSCLRGLTSLDLDNCLASLGPGIGQLTCLQELLVSHDELSYDFEVPDELGALTQLTRLELVRCVAGHLPRELGLLTRLRLLNLEGSDLEEATDELSEVLGSLVNLEELDLGTCNLADMPSTLSCLTSLTTLSLESAVCPNSWNADTWDAKLACLSTLERLLYLELADNDLRAVPSSVAGMRRLETLKLGLNPLTAAGLVDGPYLESLLHLDLRGGRFTELPQHLTRASKLQFLGLACCHDLVLDRQLAEDVLGRLPSLTTLTLCGQMMHSVESARMVLALGRMLPELDIHSHGEEGEGSDEEGDEDADEEDSDLGLDSDDGEDDFSDEDDDEEEDEEDEEEWDEEWEGQQHGGFGHGGGEDVGGSADWGGILPPDGALHGLLGSGNWNLH